MVGFMVLRKLLAEQGSPGSLKQKELCSARSPCPGSCLEKSRGFWRPAGVVTWLPPSPWAPRRQAEGHLG